MTKEKKCEHKNLTFIYIAWDYSTNLGYLGTVTKQEFAYMRCNGCLNIVKKNVIDLTKPEKEESK